VPDTKAKNPGKKSNAGFNGAKRGREKKGKKGKKIKGGLKTPQIGTAKAKSPMQSVTGHPKPGRKREVKQEKETKSNVS